MIETFVKPPAGREQEASADHSAFFSQWARQRARELGINGIYMLICKSPAHVQVEIGNDTRKKAFTEEDRARLVKILLSGSTQRSTTKDCSKGYGLSGTPWIETSPAAVDGRQQRRCPLPAAVRGEEALDSIGRASSAPGIVVLVVIWVIFAVIRGLSGMGARGGYGGGPGGGGGMPGYGPGYGGGGAADS